MVRAVLYDKYEVAVMVKEMIIIYAAMIVVIGRSDVVNHQF